MESNEFASVYTGELNRRQIHDGVLPEAMAESREWSYQFGRILHGRLTDPENPQTEKLTAMADSYIDWHGSKLPILQNWLWKQRTADSYRALNELNFHNLNGHVLGAWSAMLEQGAGDRPPRPDSYATKPAQNMLAIDGLLYYAIRENVSKINSDYAWFRPENAGVRNTVEGMLNEYDLAITLLEMVRRKPTLAVVPAPMQFEHGPIGAYNVDFVVTSQDDCAVGVQAKSQVQDTAVKVYDPSRVVLVDGRVDLGNTAGRRTKKGSSSISRVGWAGLLCAQQVKDISTTGPGEAELKQHGMHPKGLMYLKLFAMQMLGSTRPNLHQAVNIVGDRVTRRLEQAA